MSRSVSNLIKIFIASYSAVLPDKIIRNCVIYNSKIETLWISGDRYNLSRKNVYVVGAGKAVQSMAKELGNILSPKIKKGIISIPAKSMTPNLNTSSNIVYYEGAQNNLPDPAAVATTQRIKELALSLTKNDILFVLLSGGGSALLPLPKEPITLDEKLGLIKKLANSGADIKELNIVRKKISAIKGGKLAIAAKPAQIITLILSDIVDDPVDLIASGPTVKDQDDVEKAMSIIKKYKLYEELPNSIKEALEKTSPNVNLEEFPIYLIGSNNFSVLAAYDEAKHLNYHPIVLSKSVIGNVRDLAIEYVKLSSAFTDFLKDKINAELLNDELNNLNISGIKRDFIESLKLLLELKAENVCLILGGETTIEVKGTGKGGRNQQLALEFSTFIHDVKADFEGFNVYLLSAGTDGIDGPTDAAGAIGYLDLISDCQKAGISAQEFLENNDSYNFYNSFRSGEMHVVTGHTNTNVMDIHLIVIQRSNK